MVLGPPSSLSLAPTFRELVEGVVAVTFGKEVKGSPPLVISPAAAIEEVAVDIHDISHMSRMVLKLSSTSFFRCPKLNNY